MQSIMAGVRMLVQDEPHEHGAERTPERCDEERRMLTWRITELERTVEKQDRFVKDQDNRISKLTHEANKLKYDLHQTDQRKRSLENVNKALIQEMKEKDKKCKELDEHFKKCNTERIRMEQACRNQQINIHDLEAHNSELEQRLKNQQEKVDKAQKAAMILLTRDVSNDIPDDKVRKLFTDHFSRLSRWSRDNCRSSSFQPGDKLPSELRKVLVVERWPAYLSFDSCSRTAPSTMLEAALSHEVILRLFAHPFFLAGTRNAFFDPATGPGPAPGDSLLSIFNEILKENKAAAYSWRAITVQTLNAEGLTRDVKSRYFQAIVEHFLQVYKSLVKGDLPEESATQLLGIVTEFGEFALQLWSLKSTISCCGIDYFADLPFDVDSEEMDFAKTVPLEDGDPSLNGRPIPLVVQPLIVGHGGAEGGHYELKKIWSKAVVWVSAKADPRERAATAGTSPAAIGGPSESRE